MGTPSRSEQFSDIHSCRSQLPPKPPSWAFSAGRGHLKPIGDDDWSEDPSSKNSSAISTSTVSSLGASPRILSSTRKIPFLEKRITSSLISKAYENKGMPTSMAPEYMSSSESEGGDENSMASSSYTDGYSIVSSDYSFDNHDGRGKDGKPTRTKSHHKVRTHKKETSETSIELGERVSREVRKYLSRQITLYKC